MSSGVSKIVHLAPRQPTYDTTATVAGCAISAFLIVRLMPKYSNHASRANYQMVTECFVFRHPV
jgi:hypothetical protein